MADDRPGFLALPRAMFASSAWKEKREFSTFEALVDLAGLASFSVREYDYQGIRMHLAQRETPPLSVRFLMQRWGWKSTATVSRFMADLLETGKIVQNTKRNTQRNTVPNTYFIGVSVLAANSETVDRTSIGTQVGTKKKKEEEQRTKKHMGHGMARGRLLNEYDPEFEEAWTLYPKRSGNNPKIGAAKCFSARRKEGVQASALIDAARRYAAFCEATNLVGTPHTMQAQTFFGPNRPFDQEWEIPAMNGNGRKHAVTGQVSTPDDGVAAAIVARLRG